MQARLKLLQEKKVKLFFLVWKYKNYKQTVMHTCCHRRANAVKLIF